MELSWHQRPLRELLRLSWPIAASFLSFSVMTLVDTLLVGRLGRGQLAGVGLAGTLAFASICFPIGLLQGGKTLMAQAVGAARPSEARAFLVASAWTAVGLGLLVLVAGQIAASFVPGLTSSAEAGSAARTYLRIRSLGAPVSLLFVALRESSYAHGHARRPMVASLVANACNVALAVLFVFILELGVAGAAWATVIAQIIELSILAASERAWASRPVSMTYFVGLARIGLPTGVQFLLEIGSFSILSAMISLMSEVDMASHQIALQVIHFSFLPALAVGEAASVLAGQCVGAGKDHLVTRISRTALGVALTYTGFCTLAFVFGAEQIAQGFTRDRDVIRLAVRLLHIAAAFQLLDGANVVARSVLRGIGDVRYAAIVCVLSAWLCTPPLTWLLGHHFHLGARGGWLAISAEILSAVLLLWWRLERKGWRLAIRGGADAIASAPRSPAL